MVNWIIFILGCCLIVIPDCIMTTTNTYTGVGVVSMLIGCFTALIGLGMIAFDVIDATNPKERSYKTYKAARHSNNTIPPSGRRVVNKSTGTSYRLHNCEDYNYTRSDINLQPQPQYETKSEFKFRFGPWWFVAGLELLDICREERKNRC